MLKIWETINNMKKLGFIFLFTILLTSCYSIYSGGTGGVVVDAESTAIPKDGIANVNVYAYTSKSDRDADYKNWEKTGNFIPKADYYGHTTTGRDGSWSISKMVWKTGSFKSKFGKDADYSDIYLNFYHPDYGCTKAETIIMSDTYSDTICTELTYVFQRTYLTINFMDVASGNLSGRTVYTEVAVSQGEGKEDKVYKQSITSSGTILVRYPREIEPSVKINYYEANDEINWKACKNTAPDYEFYKADEVGDGIKACDSAIEAKTIKGNNYSLTYYGKATKFNMKSFAGTYGNTESESSDGIHILLKGIDKDGNFTVDLGETYTRAVPRGSNGDLTHGSFYGLGGSRYSWSDETYKGVYSTTKVRFELENGTVIKTMEIRSNESYDSLTL